MRARSPSRVVSKPAPRRPEPRQRARAARARVVCRERRRRCERGADAVVSSDRPRRGGWRRCRASGRLAALGGVWQPVTKLRNSNREETGGHEPAKNQTRANDVASAKTKGGRTRRGRPSLLRSARPALATRATDAHPERSVVRHDDHPVPRGPVGRRGPAGVPRASPSRARAPRPASSPARARARRRSHPGSPRARSAARSSAADAAPSPVRSQAQRVYKIAITLMVRFAPSRAPRSRAATRSPARSRARTGARPPVSPVGRRTRNWPRRASCCDPARVR